MPGKGVALPNELHAAVSPQGQLFTVDHAQEGDNAISISQYDIPEGECRWAVLLENQLVAVAQCVFENSKQTSGFYVLDPSHPDTAPYQLYEGERQSDGAFVVDGNIIGGGATGCAFVGTGADRKMVTFVEDLNTNLS